jgi:hypothetical protein
MEEYKEKYEMALEGIQEILDSGEDSIKMSRLKLRLQGIFPELTESEDERIRKSLISHFRNNSVSESWSGINVKKVLAWLEKQGEQSSTDKVEPKFMVGDIISNGISEVKIVSIGKDNYTVTNGEIENHAHVGNWVVYFKDQDNWRPVEQKSSWSEGDEEIVEALNDYVKNLDILFSKINIGGKDVLSKEFREKVQHWLKSIKDRVQPKQEWNEEDDKFFEELYKELRKGYEDASIEQLKDIYSRRLQWLESIKSRLT